MWIWSLWLFTVRSRRWPSSKLWGGDPLKCRNQASSQCPPLAGPTDDFTDFQAIDQALNNPFRPHESAGSSGIVMSGFSFSRSSIFPDIFPRLNPRRYLPPIVRGEPQGGQSPDSAFRLPESNRARLARFPGGTSDKQTNEYVLWPSTWAHYE
jgi:hypothetical protein